MPATSTSAATSGLTGGSHHVYTTQVHRHDYQYHWRRGGAGNGPQLPTLGDRARYVGYPFGRMAENVAQGYPDAETVVQGWMNSRAHRHNVLDGGVQETGIGIARAPGGGLYFCQVFGRRLSSI